MQFTMEAWSGIADGSITLTFRTWSMARVKVGNTYQIAPGVVRVTRVEQVTAGSITDDDAIRTGADLGSLRDRLGVDDGHLVWRIEFEFAGEDPRVALRSAVPDGEELDSLVDELMAMDRRATAGPWVRRSLQLIADNPGVRAGRSRARVQPGVGKDRGPMSPGPKRFSTDRNDPLPWADISVSTVSIASLAESCGTTN